MARLIHHDMSNYFSARALVALAFGATLACSDGTKGTAPPPGAAGPPAAAVSIQTVEPKPIERASEFIATVKSLNSTTIQPQVDGRVTRIFVKSGDHVRAGSPLLQIDPEKQVATVRNTESQRAARQADLQYWKGQVERLRSLLAAGAISKNELDTAQHSLETAQANLAALDAQVREDQVQLQYHRVTAPTSGIVGDIAVREGDRVTTSTQITTIDDKQGLEVYLQIPLTRAPELRVGLPVQLLDSEGKVIATNPISFVAPRVDDATQTVLAKASLRNMPPAMRVQQFVRARIVWRNEPGITVPIVSVLRIGGQYFCFVAEPGDKGLVAKQRPLEVGEIVGNDYVVTGGLKAGDRVIVSGVQKLADGAPVRG
jgi:RND family efflux transporter MFP subunit